jgi:hypothetical protein
MNTLDKLQKARRLFKEANELLDELQFTNYEVRLNKHPEDDEGFILRSFEDNTVSVEMYHDSKIGLTFYENNKYIDHHYYPRIQLPPREEVPQCVIDFLENNLDDELLKNIYEIITSITTKPTK